MTKEERLKKQELLYKRYVNNNDIIDSLNYEELELLLNYMYKLNLHLRKELENE